MGKASLTNLSDFSMRICLEDAVSLTRFVHYREKIPISLSEKTYFLSKAHE